jgi:aldehyde:ferredoxin oxidoreductase
MYPTVEFVAAATGWDFTAEEAIKAGRRIKALRQEFNRREGVSMNDFTLPKRVTEAPTTGPYKGRYFDHKDVAKLYMEAIGYDPATGQVKPDTLKELGLAELVASK